MALLTVQTIDRDGAVDPTYASADAGGDTFANDGKLTFVHIVNAGGSTCVVTLNFVDTLAVDGQDITDRTVSIATTEDAFIGPFPVGWYGLVPELDYDQVTSVTVAVFKID